MMTSTGPAGRLALLGIALALALPAVLMACGGGDSPDADRERAATAPRTVDEYAEMVCAEPVSY